MFCFFTIPALLYLPFPDQHVYLTVDSGQFQLFYCFVLFLDDFHTLNSLRNDQENLESQDILRKHQGQVVHYGGCITEGLLPEVSPQNTSDPCTFETPKDQEIFRQSLGSRSH